MDRSAARLTAALAPTAITETGSSAEQVTVDLTAQSGAFAFASLRHGMRSLLHARDAIDEWTIATEVRPPTVRAYEAAAAELLAAAADALEAGWQSSCAACGQAVRVAGWRWEEPLDADRDQAKPVARRATCAACRALGRRGGDATAMLPNEAPSDHPLEPDLRARVDARFAGAADGAAARWSARQLRSLDALSGALERSRESAAMLTALRLTVAEAAAAMARPHRAGRAWWEIAPWQAMLDAIDARRRIFLTAHAAPASVVMSSDLSALSYPGGGTTLLRGGGSARTALANLVARTPSIRISAVRLTVGGSAEELADRAIAATWAGERQESDPLLVALHANDAVTIAAALARLFVAMNPLLRHNPKLVIDLDDHPEQVAGVFTALSLAGVTGSITRRLDDDRTAGLSITAHFNEPPHGEVRPKSQSALIADLVVAHGEPVTARQLLPAYAAARARAAHAAGELLDAAALVAELRSVAEIRATLRPAGSFDPLIAVADERIFVEGRAERERLAPPAADRADAAAWELVSALDDGRGIDEAIVALDADPVGIGPEMRSALLDAYTTSVDGVRTARASCETLAHDRLTVVAGLVELGPRMGLYTAVAPALADLVVAGRTLASRTTIDPIDSSPPLRNRSDRTAFDAVDAILYRRGRAVLLCEVVTGPLPLGELLLHRHAQIASDPEVVRLLVVAPALVSLVQRRLAHDERLATAWDAGNWYLLATDRVAALARLPSPRLADLEGHLGAEPPQREAAQLDLSSIGWEASQSTTSSGGEHDAPE